MAGLCADQGPALGGGGQHRDGRGESGQRDQQQQPGAWCLTLPKSSDLFFILQTIFVGSR